MSMQMICLISMPCARILERFREVEKSREVLFSMWPALAPAGDEELTTAQAKRYKTFNEIYADLLKRKAAERAGE